MGAPVDVPDRENRMLPVAVTFVRFGGGVLKIFSIVVNQFRIC